MKKNTLFIILILMQVVVFSQNLTSVSPATGIAGQTLDVTITGTNTHFGQGSATTVTFGFNQGSSTVNSTTVLSPTSIQANVTIPGGVNTGNYDVSIYNNIDGSHSLLNAFHVDGAELTSVSPATGIAGQTLDVTITGTNTHFGQGSATTISFGFNQGSSTVNSTTVLSPTSIQANVTIPTNVNTGNYDVSIYNNIDGSHSLLNAFHVDGAELTSVNPATGMAGQTLDVTITGTNTHFGQGSATTVSFGFNQGSSTVNSTTVLSPTSIQANVTIPTNVNTGNYNVYFNNNIDGSHSLLNAFHVDGAELTSVNPATGTAGQTLDVTITGTNTHFGQGSATTVSFGFNQGSSTVNSTTVLSSTSIQANVTIPSNTYTGDYNISINNSIDGSRSLFNAFHVDGVVPPSLLSISPASAAAGQTLNVTITGANTHFGQGSATTVSFGFDQGSSTVNSTTVLSPTSIEANVSIPANTYIGDYSVSIYNDIDGYRTLNNAFHVNALPPASIVSISPANAIQGQALKVTITGVNTHFTQGSGTSSLYFTYTQGSGTIFINSTNIISNTIMEANVFVDTNSPIGFYNVSIYNTIDGTRALNNGFEVKRGGISTSLSLSLQSSNVSAFGLCDGSSSVSVSNGTAPYSYIWSSGETSNVISNKCSNKYTVVVTDVNGLKDSVVTYISEPTQSVSNPTTKIPIDTLVTNNDTCIIDYNFPIDSAYISAITIIDSTHVKADFAIFQSGKRITYTADFVFDKSGNNLLVLKLNCSGTFTRALKSTDISEVVNLQYDKIGVKQTLVTGISEIVVASEIKIYPNPAKEKLTIEMLSLSEFAGKTIFIYNIQGEVIQQYAIQKDKTELNIADLCSGVYLIKITTNDGVIIKRFIKE